MSKYPLDKEALVEEYGDLLIKLALKSYMKEQAQQLEQEDSENIPAPQPKGNVVAAAFRQVHWEDAKDTVLYGLKKGVTRRLLPIRKHREERENGIASAVPFSHFSIDAVTFDISKAPIPL